MKRAALIIICAALILATPMTAKATGNDGGSGVTITVVIPNPAENAAAPEPAPAAPANTLYPSSVWETQENGRREIVRTYELDAWENPEDIPGESFVREGWLYELADITRRETASVDTRDHTETVSIDTQTNEMAAVIGLLAPTMEYRSEDGYIGVLHLNIASIKTETAGTRSSSFTVRATREYPHLSSNDTSLIPKTITDGGRTLTLASVDWRAQNTVAVDYERIPESYTAAATYTGTGSSTAVTGYTTTAEYSGTIAKALTGRTVYTAYFIGIPIVTPTASRLSEPDTDCEEPPADDSGCDNAETGQPPETGIPDGPGADSGPEAESGQNSIGFLPILLSVLIGAGIGGGVAYFTMQKGKKQKEDETTHEDDKSENDETA